MDDDVTVNHSQESDKREGSGKQPPKFYRLNRTKLTVLNQTKLIYQSPSEPPADIAHSSPAFRSYRSTVNTARCWLRWSVLHNVARWFIWLCHFVGNLVNLYSFPAWPTQRDRSIFTTGKRANRATQQTEANCHL